MVKAKKVPASSQLATKGLPTPRNLFGKILSGSLKRDLNELRTQQQASPKAGCGPFLVNQV
jgi:hypothetical protein